MPNALRALAVLWLGAVRIYFIVVMKRFVTGLIGLLAVVSSSAGAEPPLEPVPKVPRLFGQEIERLVLVAPIIVDRSQPGVPFTSTLMIRIDPGIFVPVSQDEKGVYYQAVKGYRTIRGNGRIDGGLYLSKVRSGAIWAYVGKANVGSKAGLEKDRLPLPPHALRGLLTGKAETKK